MVTQLDGALYAALVESGIKHLNRYRDVLNDLNVFPVPDGDTGTNMVMTLRYGFDSLKEKTGAISDVAGRFASSAVYGARGNSGVIVSQFFKGVADSLRGKEGADAASLADALQSGSLAAYSSVSNPVEGTMLTVVKDASDAVARALPLSSVDEVVTVFLARARESLQNTPNLLPILKKAGVVDSGGSGIVYFFEGVEKHLRGEVVEAAEAESHAEAVLDLSLFNRYTSFDYGYCVEGLIQLKTDVSDFDHDAFKRELSGFGNSLVSSLEGDKLKLHVHTRTLGKLMDACQRLGEFLTVKIENMTVQNMQRKEEKREAQKFLYSADRPIGEFAVVAVATNATMQRKFFDMGADVVIMSEIAPSSEDFLNAFCLVSCHQILVFPNSANSILTSMQAGSLYKDASVSVLNCRSMAECYAALAVMDFDGDKESAIASANETFAGICQVAFYHAVKEIRYGSRVIKKNDFFALAGKELLDVCDTLEATVLKTAERMLGERECAVLTVFYGKYIAAEYIDALVSRLASLDGAPEIALVATEETVYDIIITFE